MRSFTQQSLSASNFVTQIGLEVRVSGTAHHVLGYGSPNHFRDWLVFDRGHRFQRFGLLFGEANRHRFGGFHGNYRATLLYRLSTTMSP